MYVTKKWIFFFRIFVSRKIFFSSIIFFFVPKQNFLFYIFFSTLFFNTSCSINFVNDDRYDEFHQFRTISEMGRRVLGLLILLKLSDILFGLDPFVFIPWGIGFKSKIELCQIGLLVSWFLSMNSYKNMFETTLQYLFSSQIHVKWKYVKWLSTNIV